MLVSGICSGPHAENSAELLECGHSLGAVMWAFQTPGAQSTLGRESLLGWEEGGGWARRTGLLFAACEPAGYSARAPRKPLQSLPLARLGTPLLPPARWVLTPPVLL